MDRTSADPSQEGEVEQKKLVKKVRVTVYECGCVGVGVCAGKNV